MSWLAKLAIDKEIAWKEKILDSYAWHCKLAKCFPEKRKNWRFEFGALTRIDEFEHSFHVWILAAVKPQKPCWCETASFSLKEISPTFLSHRHYVFDVRVNPIKSLVQRGKDGEPLLKPNGKRKPGKRVPIVNQDELRSWISRKGVTRCRAKDGSDVPGGFRIVEDFPLEICPMTQNHFRKEKENQAAYHGGVQFRGTLEVTDSAAFAETYHSGIGSAKSFGFGLLLLAPIKLSSQSSLGESS